VASHPDDQRRHRSAGDGAAFVDINEVNADVLTGKLATSGLHRAGRGRADVCRPRGACGGWTSISSPSSSSIRATPRSPWSGEVSSDLTVSGKSFDEDAALDALQVDGAPGDRPWRTCFTSRCSRQLVKRVHLGSAGRVGEAATAFKIAKPARIHTDGRRRRRDQPSACAGAATSAFDGSLDLELIATGLNDLEKHIRRDDNPVANVAGAIAGNGAEGAQYGDEGAAVPDAGRRDGGQAARPRRRCAGAAEVVSRKREGKNMRDACGAIRLIVAIGLGLLLAGCGGGGASVASSVGSYGTPPPGAAKAHVGVTALKVEDADDRAVRRRRRERLGDIAADELSRRCWPRAGDLTLSAGWR
jgi:hypothetical protein